MACPEDEDWPCTQSSISSIEPPTVQNPPSVQTLIKKLTASKEDVQQSAILGDSEGTVQGKGQARKNAISSLIEKFSSDSNPVQGAGLKKSHTTLNRPICESQKPAYEALRDLGTSSTQDEQDGLCKPSEVIATLNQRSVSDLSSVGLRNYHYRTRKPGNKENRSGPKHQLTSFCTGSSDCKDAKESKRKNETKTITNCETERANTLYSHQPMIYKNQMKHGENKGNKTKTPDTTKELEIKYRKENANHHFSESVYKKLTNNVDSKRKALDTKETSQSEKTTYDTVAPKNKQSQVVTGVQLKNKIYDDARVTSSKNTLEENKSDDRNGINEVSNNFKATKNAYLLLENSAKENPTLCKDKLLNKTSSNFYTNESFGDRNSELEAMPNRIETENQLLRNKEIINKIGKILQLKKEMLESNDLVDEESERKNIRTEESINQIIFGESPESVHEIEKNGNNIAPNGIENVVNKPPSAQSVKCTQVKYLALEQEEIDKLFPKNNTNRKYMNNKKKICLANKGKLGSSKTKKLRNPSAKQINKQKSEKYLSNSDISDIQLDVEDVFVKEINFTKQASPDMKKRALKTSPKLVELKSKSDCSIELQSSFTLNLIYQDLETDNFQSKTSCSMSDKSLSSTQKENINKRRKHASQLSPNRIQNLSKTSKSKLSKKSTKAIKRLSYLEKGTKVELLNINYSSNTRNEESTKYMNNDSNKYTANIDSRLSRKKMTSDYQSKIPTPVSRKYQGKQSITSSHESSRKRSFPSRSNISSSDTFRCFKNSEAQNTRLIKSHVKKLKLDGSRVNIHEDKHQGKARNGPTSTKQPPVDLATNPTYYYQDIFGTKSSSQTIENLSEKIKSVSSDLNEEGKNYKLNFVAEKKTSKEGMPSVQSSVPIAITNATLNLCNDKSEETTRSLSCSSIESNSLKNTKHKVLEPTQKTDKLLSTQPYMNESKTKHKTESFTFSKRFKQQQQQQSRQSFLTDDKSILKTAISSAPSYKKPTETSQKLYSKRLGMAGNSSVWKQQIKVNTKTPKENAGKCIPNITNHLPDEDDEKSSDTTNISSGPINRSSPVSKLSWQSKQSGDGSESTSNDEYVCPKHCDERYKPLAGIDIKSNPVKISAIKWQDVGTTGSKDSLKHTISISTMKSTAHRNKSRQLYNQEEEPSITQPNGNTVIGRISRSGSHGSICSDRSNQVRNVLSFGCINSVSGSRLGSNRHVVHRGSPRRKTIGVPLHKDILGKGSNSVEHALVSTNPTENNSIVLLNKRPPSKVSAAKFRREANSPSSATRSQNRSKSLANTKSTNDFHALNPLIESAKYSDIKRCNPGKAVVIINEPVKCSDNIQGSSNESSLFPRNNAKENSETEIKVSEFNFPPTATDNFSNREEEDIYSLLSSYFKKIQSNDTTSRNSKESSEAKKEGETSKGYKQRQEQGMQMLFRQVKNAQGKISKTSEFVKTRCVIETISVKKSDRSESVSSKSKYNEAGTMGKEIKKENCKDLPPESNDVSEIDHKISTLPIESHLKETHTEDPKISNKIEIANTDKLKDETSSQPLQIKIEKSGEKCSSTEKSSHLTRHFRNASASSGKTNLIILSSDSTDKRDDNDDTDINLLEHHDLNVRKIMLPDLLCVPKEDFTKTEIVAKEKINEGENLKSDEKEEEAPIEKEEEAPIEKEEEAPLEKEEKAPTEKEKEIDNAVTVVKNKFVESSSLPVVVHIEQSNASTPQQANTEEQNESTSTTMERQIIREIIDADGSRSGTSTWSSLELTASQTISETNSERFHEKHRSEKRKENKETLFCTAIKRSWENKEKGELPQQIPNKISPIKCRSLVKPDVNIGSTSSCILSRTNSSDLSYEESQLHEENTVDKPKTEEFSKFDIFESSSNDASYTSTEGNELKEKNETDCEKLLEETSNSHSKEISAEYTYKDAIRQKILESTSFVLEDSDGVASKVASEPQTENKEFFDDEAYRSTVLSIIINSDVGCQNNSGHPFLDKEPATIAGPKKLKIDNREKELMNDMFSGDIDFRNRYPLNLCENQNRGGDSHDSKTSSRNTRTLASSSSSTQNPSNSVAEYSLTNISGQRRNWKSRSISNSSKASSTLQSSKFSSSLTYPSRTSNTSSSSTVPEDFYYNFGFPAANASQSKTNKDESESNNKFYSPPNDFGANMSILKYERPAKSASPERTENIAIGSSPVSNQVGTGIAAKINALFNTSVPKSFTKYDSPPKQTKTNDEAENKNVQINTSSVPGYKHRARKKRNFGSAVDSEEHRYALRQKQKRQQRLEDFSLSSTEISMRMEAKNWLGNNEQSQQIASKDNSKSEKSAECDTRSFSERLFGRSSKSACKGNKQSKKPEPVLFQFEELSIRSDKTSSGESDVPNESPKVAETRNKAQSKTHQNSSGKQQDNKMERDTSPTTSVLGGIAGKVADAFRQLSPKIGGGDESDVTEIEWKKFEKERFAKNADLSTKLGKQARFSNCSKTGNKHGSLKPEKSSSSQEEQRNIPRKTHRFGIFSSETKPKRSFKVNWGKEVKEPRFKKSSKSKEHSLLDILSNPLSIMSNDSLDIDNIIESKKSSTKRSKSSSLQNSKYNHESVKKMKSGDTSSIEDLKQAVKIEKLLRRGASHSVDPKPRRSEKDNCCRQMRDGKKRKKDYSKETKLFDLLSNPLSIMSSESVIPDDWFASKTSTSAEKGIKQTASNISTIDSCLDNAYLSDTSSTVTSSDPSDFYVTVNETLNEKPQRCSYSVKPSNQISSPVDAENGLSLSRAIDLTRACNILTATLFGRDQTTSDVFELNEKKSATIETQTEEITGTVNKDVETSFKDYLWSDKRKPVNECAKSIQTSNSLYDYTERVSKGSQYAVNAIKDAIADRLTKISPSASPTLKTEKNRTNQMSETPEKSEANNLSFFQNLKASVTNKLRSPPLKEAEPLMTDQSKGEGDTSWVGWMRNNQNDTTDKKEISTKGTEECQINKDKEGFLKISSLRDIKNSVMSKAYPSSTIQETGSETSGDGKAVSPSSFKFLSFPQESPNLKSISLKSQETKDDAMSENGNSIASIVKGELVKGIGEIIGTRPLNISCNQFQTEHAFYKAIDKMYKGKIDKKFLIREKSPVKLKEDTHVHRKTSSREVKTVLIAEKEKTDGTSFQERWDRLSSNKRHRSSPQECIKSIQEVTNAFSEKAADNIKNEFRINLKENHNQEKVYKNFIPFTIQGKTTEIQTPKFQISKREAEKPNKIGEFQKEDEQKKGLEKESAVDWLTSKVGLSNDSFNTIFLQNALYLQEDTTEETETSSESRVRKKKRKPLIKACRKKTKSED